MNDIEIRAYEWAIAEELRLGRPEFEKTLRERLLSEECEKTAAILKRYLGKLYYSMGQTDSGRAILLATSRESDRVIDWVGTAESELYFGDVRLAEEFIGAAVKLAFERQEFRRYSLGVAARIALRQDKYDEFEEVVKRIADLGHGARIDCAIETDFIERAPSHALSDETKRRYLQLAREASTDS